MEELTTQEQSLLLSGLQKMEENNSRVISQYFLDDDLAQIVKDANSNLILIKGLRDLFSLENNVSVISVNKNPLDDD